MDLKTYSIATDYLQNNPSYRYNYQKRIFTFLKESCPQRKVTNKIKGHF